MIRFQMEGSGRFFGRGGGPKGEEGAGQFGETLATRLLLKRGCFLRPRRKRLGGAARSGKRVASAGKGYCKEGGRIRKKKKRNWLLLRCIKYGDQTTGRDERIPDIKTSSAKERLHEAEQRDQGLGRGGCISKYKSARKQTGQLPSRSNSTNCKKKNQRMSTSHGETRKRI